MLKQNVFPLLFPLLEHTVVSRYKVQNFYLLNWPLKRSIVDNFKLDLRGKLNLIACIEK